MAGSCRRPEGPTGIAAIRRQRPATGATASRAGGSGDGRGEVGQLHGRNADLRSGAWSGASSGLAGSGRRGWGSVADMAQQDSACARNASIVRAFARVCTQHCASTVTPFTGVATSAVPRFCVPASGFSPTSSVMAISPIVPGTSSQNEGRNMTLMVAMGGRPRLRRRCLHPQLRPEALGIVVGAELVGNPHAGPVAGAAADTLGTTRF